MPAYEKYLPSLLIDGPDRKDINGEFIIKNEEDQSQYIQSYQKAPVLKVNYLLILIYLFLFFY